MSEQSPNNPSAFPTFANDEWGDMRPIRGMSLRDYFAAKAMQGVLMTCASHDGADQLERLCEAPYEAGNGLRWMAERAYQLADAMLKARQA